MRTWIEYQAPDSPPDAGYRHTYYEHDSAAPPESGVKLGTVVPIQRHWLVTVGRFSASAITLEAGKLLAERYADEGNAMPDVPRVS